MKPLPTLWGLTADYHVWSKRTGKRHWANFGGYDTWHGEYIFVWHDGFPCKEFNWKRKWKLSKRFQREFLK